MARPPWFLWDVEIDEATWRERLRHPEPAVRAQWQGHLLREAPYREVWKYVTLDEVLGNWTFIERHLGRRRAFWQWLLAEWRRNGLLQAG